LSENEGKVLKLIEQSSTEVISFLRDLVRKPSITGQEAEIQGMISDRLKDAGLSVDVWEPDPNVLMKHEAYIRTPIETGYDNRPNVVGILKGTGGGRSLILNGHVDVVTPGPLDRWIHDPWRAEIEGGRLYGRGASDMKSGLAAAIMAVICITRAGMRLKGDTTIEAVVDEEPTGDGTLACIMRGYTADAAILAEATDLEIQPTHTGALGFGLKVMGKAASVSRKWEAVSAIEKGWRACQALQDFEAIRQKDKHHPLYSPQTLSLYPGTFRAGVYQTILPEEARIEGIMRTLPNEELSVAKKDFQEYIRAFSQLDPWLRENPIALEWIGYHSAGSEIPVDHVLVKTVGEAFRYCTGLEPKITGHIGAADAKYFTKYSNTPALLFGPGALAQMHATNEYVPLENVVTATKVLASTIIRWCGIK